MPRKICIVTGPIVGLNSTDLIDETIAFARTIGEDIVVFNLFDEIIELSGGRPRNAFETIIDIGQILDGYFYQFQCLREKAYLSLARKIELIGKDKSVIIRTPASIEWRGFNVILKDHRIIADVIKPNLIVTLVNAEWKIQDHLRTNYGKKALGVVAHQKELSIPKILEWLASEVSVSEDWAEWATFLTGKKVKQIVFGIETPSLKDKNKYVMDVEGLAKLVTQEDVPTFYASYSMTVADDEIREKINTMIWKLRAYGVVIDPASIELGGNVEPEHKSTVFVYTVCRDLRWDVQKVDAVMAFHPYEDMPPLSTGMMDELGHARAYGKDRYLVMPVGGGSPFTSDNYVPANHIFKTDAELFEFIEKRRRPPLKPQYKKFQAAFATWQDSINRRKKKRK